MPLGEGRVLMEPAVIARLVQLTAIAAGERALVVAAGTGYGAALLAACGARVTALEESASLQAVARSVLAELAPSVQPGRRPARRRLAAGRALRRHPDRGRGARHPAGDRRAVAPADRPAGRGSAPAAAGICQAVLAEATAAGLRTQPMFDCATPPIPSLLPSPGFVF